MSSLGRVELGHNGRSDGRSVDCRGRDGLGGRVFGTLLEDLTKVQTLCLGKSDKDGDCCQETHDGGKLNVEITWYDTGRSACR